MKGSGAWTARLWRATDVGRGRVYGAGGADRQEAYVYTRGSAGWIGEPDAQETTGLRPRSVDWRGTARQHDGWNQVNDGRRESEGQCERRRRRGAALAGGRRTY